VFFTLVVGLAEGRTAPVPPPREGLPEEAGVLHGKRVLVVDDHPINRMLMAKLLKLANAEAVPAENGVDALRVLQQQGGIDLVLMDLRMPEMDGYEATRRIRSDARWGRLPIVAVTASAATYERARCLAVGMNDVIVKPIHQTIFFPVVAAAMKSAED
jgi:CheY-like chemotaxis protein